MNPYSRAFTRLCGFMIMLAPEGKEGGAGGGTTLKEQLATAEKDRDEFKAAAEKAETDLKTEQTAHGKTKASLQAAEKSRDEHKARADKAEEDLTAEQEAHEALKAKDTTATGKAAEALAANRIAAGKKQTPTKLTEQPTDGAALHDEYSKLRGRARAAFFAKHKAELMAYAVANPGDDEDSED
ncbi:MAG: hypothetical protein P4L99_28055 [Chthoniobacter sp.]|nr:hypothetical protein [Chthoniobacter sp.]